MCVCLPWPAQIYVRRNPPWFFFHSPTYSINGHNSLFRNRSFHRTRSAQTILLALLPIRQIWPSRVLSALELWAKFGAFWETAIRHHIIRLVFAHSQTRGGMWWWHMCFCCWVCFFVTENSNELCDSMVWPCDIIGWTAFDTFRKLTHFLKNWPCGNDHWQWQWVSSDSTGTRQAGVWPTIYTLISFWS